MKTLTTYPLRTKLVKAFGSIAIILTSIASIAADSAEVKKELKNTTEAIESCNTVPNTIHSGVSLKYLNEVAIEPEYEIEEWMCNVHNECRSDKTIEEELELEDWMYNTSHSFWQEINNVQEEEIAIEEWMTKPDEWLEADFRMVLTSR